ncbi:hypothetical protein FN846DRAFT_764885, partial [Sphaerosporella brunnea]
SVKRSLVKAELTRYMILSSQKCYFEESKRTLFMNLRRRGYPAVKLSEFEMQVQYETRLSVLQATGKKAADKEIPLLIPSLYNDVWNHLNLRPIFEAMTSTWSRNGVAIPDSLCGPLIKSLRRSDSFFDKTIKWNARIL